MHPPTREGPAVLSSNDQLEAVISLGRRRIGAAHPDVRVLGRRINAQPYCLETRWFNGNQLGAYSIVYSLNEDATNAIHDSVIIQGSDIEVVHLASERRGVGLYVAALVALPGHEMSALEVQKYHLRSLLDQNQRAEWLFARSASSAGHRLLRRFQFEPLPPPSEISARTLDSAFRSLISFRAANSRIELSTVSRKTKTRNVSDPAKEPDPD